MDKHAKVPSRLIYSALKDENEEVDLWNWHKQNDFPSHNKELDGLASQLSGEDLQLLAGLFYKAGISKHQFNSQVIFRKKNEWITLSHGGEKSDNKDIKAADALFKEKTIFFTRNKRKYFFKGCLLTKGEHDDEKFVVNIADVLTESNSFKILPLGMRASLRNAGIKRVQSAHIKLWTYCIVHTDDKWNVTTHKWTYKKVFHAMGVSHYLKQGNHPERAYTLLENGLKAMVNLGLLSKFTLGKCEFSIDITEQLQPRIVDNLRPFVDNLRPFVDNLRPFVDIAKSKQVDFTHINKAQKVASNV